MAQSEHEKRSKIDLIWTRPERTSPAKAPPLSREYIVAAAIEIADAEGIEALSMRRIAGKLGVGTMSLYWHVPSKQDLLELMLDAALGEIELPEQLYGDWRADLRKVSLQMRNVLLHHPWLASLFDNRSSLGPNGLRHSEFSLAAIDGLGLDFFTMKRVLVTVDSYVLGFVLNTAAEEEARRRSGLSEQEWQTAVGPYLREVFASGKYPTFARRINEEEESSDQEADFVFGLDCVLDGIAAHIAKHRPPSSNRNLP